MLSKLLSPDEWLGDLGKLWLRIALGGGMLFGHGMPKTQDWTQNSAVFPEPFDIGSPTTLGLAIFAEAFAAGLLVVGLVTRLSLIPLIATMGVAFFMIHGADPW